MAKHNGSSALADNPLTRMVKSSANQALHAGRDAYSRAGSEGSRIVGGLVSLGGRIDRETKSRVYVARNSASDAWERLGAAFVHRVARALNALQIPTARDVHELNRRVESLQKAVLALELRLAQQAADKPGSTQRGGRAAGKTRSAARPAAGKPAAKAPPRAGQRAGSKSGA